MGADITPRDNAAWRDFLAASAAVGQDLALVQAAGGNTSLKLGDQMWIKASGTWLADAESGAVMVPVDLAAMRARLAAGDLAEGDIAAMTGRLAGAAAMRASVETPFHALFARPCVMHVHCVATIAHAIAEDAPDRLARALDGLNWVWQPYVKPGVPLTFEMQRSGAANADIVVLGNHGLIVSADTPGGAVALVRQVHERLSPRAMPRRDAAFAGDPAALQGSGYSAAPGQSVHALAQRPELLALAAHCAIAPDFVVFFGPSLPVVQDGPDLAERLTDLAAQPQPLNAVVLIEGQGAVIRNDAMRGTAELLHGYHQVLARFLAVGGGAIRYFTDEQVAELLNWDAEKYRQQLNRGQADG